MILELARGRALNGPVAGVMWSGSDLINENTLRRREEFYRQDADGVDSRGHGQSDAFGRLGDIDGQRGGEVDFNAHAVSLNGVNDGIHHRLTTPTRNDGNGHFGHEGDSLFQYDCAGR